ncbi:MAG: UGSC family (seleno)protein, partial [Chloroflexota bacterium]
MTETIASERIPLPDDASAIFDYYEERGWTDGLPIIPPTEERVRQMLGGTRLAPDKSLGQIPPSNSD